MAKKQDGTSKKTRGKKKEIIFNFSTMRRKLTQSEKDRLVKFYISFRNDFKSLQEDLFKLNKKFDLLEIKFKQFQQDAFKEESSENDFVLNNDEIAELFGQEENKNNSKDEKEKDKDKE